jgi:predicted O-methyltransferase YrrM
VLGLAAGSLDQDLILFRDEDASLEGQSLFSLAHNADKDLAQLCYVTCRVLRPQAVVETGVRYGISSAYILQALHIKGCGRLWTVDLPPLAPADTPQATSRPTDGEDGLDPPAADPWMGV